MFKTQVSFVSLHHDSDEKIGNLLMNAIQPTLIALVSNLKKSLRYFNFGNKKQLAFLEDLYLLIRDGIPANRAIEMMAQSTTGITQEVALFLSKKISEGKPLADGMLNWFSPNIVEIIRVGEEGGALTETMQSAIKSLSQRSSAISAFVSALVYPIFVITIACIVIVYLQGSVFNQFLLIKPIDQWPDAGIQLLKVASWIKKGWWIFILFCIFIFFAIKNILENYTGEFRASLDGIPPFSLYRQLISARMLETLGLLVSNGVVFKTAIKVMQYQGNPYMNYHLTQMEHLLGMGKTNIADVLATGLISHEDLMRLRVMAEVKGFEHGLIRMGVRGSENAAQTLTLISKVLGGLLLCMGTGLIILILRGIYLTGMSMGT